MGLTNKKTTCRGGKTLEHFLIAQNLLTPEQLTQVQHFISEMNANMGTAVMFLGVVEPEKLGLLLGKKMRIPRIENPSIVLSVRKLIKPEVAMDLQVAPLNVLVESGQRVLLLGMTDPLDDMAAAEVERVSGMRVQATFLTIDQLQDLYRRYYHKGLDLYPPEVTVHGRTGSFAAVITSKVARSGNESKQVEALINLLERKGILTREELNRELAKLT